MSLRFTPPKVMGKYALFVDSSYRPFFKVYNELGSAKLAARARALPYYTSRGPIRNNAKILEMIDGEWWVLYDIKAGDADLPWIGEYTTHFGNKRYGARPLTREDYAEFRAKVALEQYQEKQRGALVSV